jgi:hypothetical protein
LLLSTEPERVFLLALPAPFGDGDVPNEPLALASADAGEFEGFVAGVRGICWGSGESLADGVFLRILSMVIQEID